VVTKRSQPGLCHVGTPLIAIFDVIAGQSLQRADIPGVPQ